MEDRIRACLTRHPNWDDRRISKALNVALPAVAAARNGTAAGKPADPAKRGKTLQHFRAQFDVRERIRAGIRVHLAGVYLTDPEFREACGILPQDWRRFADLEEFQAFRWRFKGLLYWAQPKLLAAMRETVGAV